MEFNGDFFLEEEREGFIVPEMMKRAWAAALEVLEVIENACETLRINYYAYAGTLLGAVRSNGFIPWDDDIDICMLQDDYFKFLKEAPSILPEGFVISGTYAKNQRLQDANNEPQARIIADETFFSLPKYMNRFHSYPYMRIGVDIFPLFYVPTEIDDQYKLLETINEMQVTARYLEYFKKRGELKTRIRKFEEILDKSINSFDEKDLIRNIRIGIDSLASKESNDKEYVSSILYNNFPGKREDFKGIQGYKTEWFGNGIKHRFESTEIIIPSQYENVLKTSFGDDYNIPKRFTSEHEYPCYKNQEEAFKKLLIESGVFTPVDEFCRNWHALNGGT